MASQSQSQSHSRPPSAPADNPVASRRDIVAAAVTIVAVAGAAEAAQAQTGSSVRRFDPPGMTSPPTYNHVVEVNGPHRVVYIAGQTGVDKDGKMAQGFRAQAVQVMENIKIALSAVGGSFDNVVKLNKVQAVDDRDLNFPTGQQSLPTEGKAIKFLAHCNKTCQNRL